MPVVRRKFDQGFREGSGDCAGDRQADRRDRSGVGVGAGTLGNWVAKDRAEHEGAQGLSANNVGELTRLRGRERAAADGARCLKRWVVLWVGEATK
jgi:hypothetical protein